MQPEEQTEGTTHWSWCLMSQASTHAPRRWRAGARSAGWKCWGRTSGGAAGSSGAPREGGAGAALTPACNQSISG